MPTMMFVPTVIKLKKVTIKNVSDLVNIFIYLVLSLIRHFILEMINKIVQSYVEKRNE